MKRIFAVLIFLWGGVISSPDAYSRKIKCIDIKTNEDNACSKVRGCSWIAPGQAGANITGCHPNGTVNAERKRLETECDKRPGFKWDDKNWNCITDTSTRCNAFKDEDTCGGQGRNLGCLWFAATTEPVKFNEGCLDAGSYASRRQRIDSANEGNKKQACEKEGRFWNENEYKCEDIAQCGEGERLNRRANKCEPYTPPPADPNSGLRIATGAGGAVAAAISIGTAGSAEDNLKRFSDSLITAQRALDEAVNQ
ncbi:MAG: hypothetical protein FWD15_00985 [Alphaproteobacteria bacterium]|nr:hypothetical protein [Alphaproteobacteria bacterium]